MHVASLTIEQLHDRFMLEQCPYWDLFNARGKERIGKFRDDDESIVSDEERVLYAWLQLEELLNTIPYGRAKIVLKKSPSANVTSAITLNVQWGTSPATRGRAPGLGSTISGPAFAPQGQEGMLMMIIKMQEETSRRESSARDAAHAREMENMRLLLETKFEAQNLQAQIEGIQEGGGGGNIELVKDIVGMVMPFIRPSAPISGQLGVAGQGASDEIDHDPSPAPSVDAEGNSPAERKFSLDLALQHISVIRKNLPEHNINDVIKALALYTQQDPAQAKAMIGVLIQNVSS